jgi:hypothetical protein
MSQRTTSLISCPSRTTRFNYPVHYRLHRWCRSVQRRLARYQLANGGLDLLGLVHHSADSWSHFRLLDGLHHVCTQLGNSGHSDVKSLHNFYTHTLDSLSRMAKIACFQWIITINTMTYTVIVTGSIMSYAYTKVNVGQDGKSYRRLDGA